jgi:hypothetical protein
LDWTCACSHDDPCPVYIPAGEVPLYKEHGEACARRFQEARRVVILCAGGTRKANQFLWVERIGLDFGKIVAFLKTPTLSKEWIQNYRILPLEEVRALQPDLYVVPFDLPRNLLRQMYGDSPVWDLSDQELCMTPAFAEFKRALGAEIVHLLPFDPETGKLITPGHPENR